MHRLYLAVVLGACAGTTLSTSHAAPPVVGGVIRGKTGVQARTQTDAARQAANRARQAANRAGDLGASARSRAGQTADRLRNSARAGASLRANSQTRANAGRAGLRLNAGADARVNANAGRANGRPDDRENSSGEPRGRGVSPEDRVVRFETRSEWILAHRLAQIDRKRDAALDRGEFDAMARLDWMESQARFQHEQRLRAELQREGREPDEPARPAPLRQSFRRPQSESDQADPGAREPRPAESEREFSGARGSLSGSTSFDGSTGSDFGFSEARIESRSNANSNVDVNTTP